MEQEDLYEAMKEWRCAEEVEYLDPMESCKLCEHPEIRYEHTIFNLYTGEKLFTGNRCILQFDALSVLAPDGVMIKGQENRKTYIHQQELTHKHLSKVYAMLSSVSALSGASTNYLQQYKENHGLLPSQAVAIAACIKATLAPLKESRKARDNAKRLYKKTHEKKHKQAWETLVETTEALKQPALQADYSPVIVESKKDTLANLSDNEVKTIIQWLTPLQEEQSILAHSELARRAAIKAFLAQIDKHPKMVKDRQQCKYPLLLDYFNERAGLTHAQKNAARAAVGQSELSTRLFILGHIKTIEKRQCRQYSTPTRPGVLSRRGFFPAASSSPAPGALSLIHI